MTTAQLAKRLDAIEARRQPPAQIYICWCPEDEKHRPDCPAAGAGDGDHIVWVTYEDVATDD